MEMEPELPVVDFFSDKKAKQKAQAVLEKRQKKRKQADPNAYRVPNKAPIGVSPSRKGPTQLKSQETPNKKRKTSESSEEEQQENDFETMLPDSSDEENNEDEESSNIDADDISDGDSDVEESENKIGKTRLGGVMEALLAGASPVVSAESGASQSSDSSDEAEEDANVPILSDVKKTSAQRRAEKKAAKDALRADRELRLQRKLLKNKDHIVLDSITMDFEKESRLRKIATKGAVKLFNAIRAAQKGGDEELSSNKKSKKEKAEPMSKEKFLEILQRDRNVSAENASRMLAGELPAAETVSVKSEKQQQSGQSSWKILRDDYLLGARMKDWDKEHSDDELNEQEQEQEDEDQEEYESE